MRPRKFKRNRIFILNDPYSQRINKSLACEIGLNESIIFLQLEYLLNIGGKEIDGKRWIWKSVRDWTEEFPYWSKDTINRALKNLISKGLVIEANYNTKKYDRTRWLTINYEQAAKLKSITVNHINDVPESQPPDEESPSQNDTRKKQNDTRKKQNETTIPETTTETTTGEEGVLPKNPGKGKKPRPYPTNGSSTSPPPTDKGFSDNSAGGARTPTSPVTDEMLADVVSDTRDGPPKINKSLTEIANKEHRIVALVEFVRDLYTNKLGYAHPDWIMPPYSTQYYQKLSALCEDDGMAAKLCQTVEWIAKCNPKHDMSMLEFVKAIEDRAYSFQEKKKPYDIKRVQGSFLERKQHQKNAAEARPSYGMITG